MHRFLFAAPFILASSEVAVACSKNDIQAKTDELMAVAQQMAAKNPKAAREWSRKTRQKIQEMQTRIKADDYAAACKFYDQLIAEAKKKL